MHNHEEESCLLGNESVKELIELRKAVTKKLKESGTWHGLSERPNWDEYWSFVAYAVSLRGSCVRRQVGAVFVDKDNAILSTGYNGKAADLTNCADKPCSGAHAGSGSNLDSCEAVHAEINALMRCKDLASLHTVYVTCSPCVHCVTILLNTPAKRIVFTEEYAHNSESKRRWVEAGREWVYLQK